MDIQQEINAAERRYLRVQEYLAADPANVHLLNEAIDLQVKLGNLPGAQQCARDALAVHPADAGLRCKLANVLIEMGRLDEAEPMLEALLEYAEQDVGIVYNLAFVYFQTQRFETALALFERYPAAVSHHEQGTVLKAYSLHHLGQAGPALEVVEEHLRTHPDDLNARGLESLLELDLGNLPQAEVHARAALAGAPDNVAALIALGYCRLLAQDFAGAREQFERVLSVRSTEGRSWLGLALVDLATFRMREALTAFGQAVQYLSKYANAWIGQGWCQLLLGELDAAEASLREAVALDHNIAECHGSLAVVLAVRGVTAEAQQAAQVAMRLDATCMSAKYAQAILSGKQYDAKELHAFGLGILRTREERDGPSGLADLLLRRTLQENSQIH